MRTLQTSKIRNYEGSLRLVQDGRGNRYLAIRCSLKGERFFGPLKRHEVMSFNAIANIEEVDADTLDQSGADSPSQTTLRGTDVASTQEEETEFFVFGLSKKYEQGSLDEHLSYLRNYSGTPDFLAAAETLPEAVDEARGSVPAAITNDRFEVVSVIE